VTGARIISGNISGNIWYIPGDIRYVSGNIQYATSPRLILPVWDFCGDARSLPSFWVTLV
jgi:hypothetical protein